MRVYSFSTSHLIKNNALYEIIWCKYKECHTFKSTRMHTVYGLYYIKMSSSSTLLHGSKWHFCLFFFRFYYNQKWLKVKNNIRLDSIFFSRFSFVFSIWSERWFSVCMACVSLNLRNESGTFLIFIIYPIQRTLTLKRTQNTHNIIIIIIYVVKSVLTEENAVQTKPIDESQMPKHSKIGNNETRMSFIFIITMMTLMLIETMKSAILLEENGMQNFGKLEFRRLCMFFFLLRLFVVVIFIIITMIGVVVAVVIVNRKEKPFVLKCVLWTLLYYINE